MSPRNSDFSRHDLNPFSLCRNIQNGVIYQVDAVLKDEHGG